LDVIIRGLLCGATRIDVAAVDIGIDGVSQALEQEAVTRRLQRQELSEVEAPPAVRVQCFIHADFWSTL
jgi:hypothetical protein